MKNGKMFAFALVLTVTACGQPGPSSQQRTELQAAYAGRLPHDYQKIVDQRLAQELKDPDSRKVQFAATPYGGLVCGTVNAKNSYGGFTGGQPFFAVFDAEGNLSSFETHSYSDLNGYGREGLIDLQFFRACGTSPI